MENKRLILSWWLFGCAFMVLAMTVIGAITRLTESGLSITEWNVVMGAVPPLNQEQWLIEFEKYKQTPEFVHKHAWMSVEDFKGIFFWEWLHRLWGRLIGLVYALPLLAFWIKGWVPQDYKKKLIGLLVLGGLQGFMGWFMVQSGLVDRPSVSHYRLAAHLLLALIIYCSLVWVGLSLRPHNKTPLTAHLKPHGIASLAFTFVTILWGAFVAGLDAGMIYNEFPNMGAGLVPPEMWAHKPAWINLFENHATVQFTHRWLAIITMLVVLSYAWRGKFLPLAAMIFVQVGLGIMTLLTQVSIPVAAAHQLGAVITLTLIIISLQRQQRS